MCRLVRCGWLAGLLLLGQACGYRPVSGALEDDGGMARDGSTDGPPPCTFDCASACKLADGCGLVFPNGTCMTVCLGSKQPSPELLCLAQAACTRAACTSAIQCLSNPTVPDLVVRYTATGGNAQIAFSAEVCNIGNGPSTPTRLHYYLNPQVAPVAGSVGTGTISVSAIKAGACQAASRAHGALSAGSYVTYMQIDADRAVIESNETNNLAGPQSVQVQGGTAVDLVVQSFTATGTANLALYTATVCNTGQATSKDVSLGIYYDADSAPSPSTKKPDQLVTIGPLAAGACTTPSIPAAKLKAGTYRSWAFVDVLQQQAESSEANNANGPKTVVVTDGGPGPDLVVSRVDTVPSTGGIGFTIEVCNYGQQQTPTAFVLSLYHNRNTAPTSTTQPDQELKAGPLKSGECAKVSASAPLGPGTYNAWVHVDRQNFVAENNESNNVFGPKQYVIGGPSAPDLVITSFTGSPSFNGFVYYSVNVCNYGKSTAANARVEVYYDRATAPTAATPSDANQTLSLAAGQCGLRSFTATLAPGTYQSWAYVDRANQIAELDEGNNLNGPIKVTVGTSTQADLVVSSFSATPLSGPQGVLYSVMVCNKGAATASASTVGIYEDPPGIPGPPQKPIRVLNIPSLSSGACSTQTQSAVLSGGGHSAFAYADVFLQVAETDENNNLSQGIKFIVGGPPPAVDLTVATFSGVAAPGPGPMVSYTIYVCNNGPGPSFVSSVLGLYVNRPAPPNVGDKPDATFYVGPFAPGACNAITHNAPTPPGKITSWAFVDVENTTAESNELNNIRSLVLNSGGGAPDLTVSGFTAQALGAGSVMYNVQVCNLGAAPAPPTTIGLYYNLSSAPTLTSPPSQQLNLSPLGPGQCNTQITSASLQAGTYSSWAMVDEKDAVPEANESNNVAGPRVVSVGGSVECSTICGVLVSPCGFLPSGGTASCVTNCTAQSQDRVACAYKAASSQPPLCSTILQCLFSTP